VLFRSLIDEVTHIVRAIAFQKRITVTHRLDPALRQGLFLDPARLKQIVYNFLSNALKFTPEGGTVEIRATAEGDAAFRIEVEDNGPGIAPQDLPRLFSEFQQLDAGARQGGTGLGLALTRRLAEAQGGYVDVRSQVGRGSTFYAVLPRRTPTRPVPGPAPGALPMPRVAEKGNVLVVDDDASSLRLMSAALFQLGFRADCVDEPERALRLAEQMPPTAVVLDLLMPKIDGFEFLRRFRGSPANQHTPVIIWTVKDLEARERERLEGIAQGFLRKGQGSIQALLKELGQFLGNPGEKAKETG